MQDYLWEKSYIAKHSNYCNIYEKYLFPAITLLCIVL
jgi:hypothetical protein